jgi:hypothetical protein
MDQTVLNKADFYFWLDCGVDDEDEDEEVYFGFDETYILKKQSKIFVVQHKIFEAMHGIDIDKKAISIR